MMCFRWLSLLVSLGAALAQTPKLGGDYLGMLGALHLKLHLKVGASGATEGTLDSVDQGAIGLACANFRLDEKCCPLMFRALAASGTAQYPATEQC